jgi:ATP-dependent exoDNAse (exonuclease V) beta subunit
VSDKLNVEFVRAGAGSGKTYHLTQLLAKHLRDGTARAQAVIATTFTVKAATELRERARSSLLREGRLDLAAAIGQARIGTVNAVCGQLIQRFCFELGISPDQTVVDEDGVRRLIQIAIESVQTPEASSHLLGLARRLGIAEDVLADRIRDIVNLARSNNIASDDVAAMGVTNAGAMLACWPPPTGDHTAAMEQALATAQTQIEDAIAAGNRTEVLRKGLDQVATARDAFAQDRFTWGDWHKLLEINAGANQRTVLAPVIAIAGQHDTHLQFHDDVRQYIESVFSLAARAMHAFEQAKAEQGVVDFTDQEVMLLRAIRDSDLVRGALHDELDLVLVDEFQDTNPLQLAIFVELAKLSKASIWVGDQKQAIYGFRGTDSNLIQQILSEVEKWGGSLGEPLTESWRSTPALVGLANEVFGEAFKETTTRKDVVLTPKREGIPGQPDILNWSFSRGSNRRSFDLTAMGPAVHGLLERDFRVFDKEAGQLRALQASDIAVLCRYNDEIPQIVEALGRWSIPAAAGRAGLLRTPEARLVLACLRRLHDRADTIASATIVGLTDSLRPEKWLADRLQFLANVQVDEQGRFVPDPRDWRVLGDDSHPLLARLEALRPRLLSLTPCEALRLAKAESGVAGLVHQWSPNDEVAQVRMANVEALLALGADYESACVGLHQPATVNGLLLWLAQRADKARDLRAANARGAVEVMTLHSAKGLEWPVVVVAGLHQRHRTDLWSVRARTIGDFDASKPLASRFIHYWPYPYGRVWDVPAAQVAERSDTGKAMDRAAMAENTRLLYVTLTRARDMLVLVRDTWPQARPTRLDWLEEVDNARATLWGKTGEVNVDGALVTRENVEWDGDAAAVRPRAADGQTLRFFETGTPHDFERLWFTPSSAQATGYRVAEVEDVGTRIAVRRETDFRALGSAIHGCIAYAHADPDKALTADEVDAILKAWGVGGAVEPAAVISQVQAFSAWWRAKWPQAQAQAEVPVEARRPDGSIVRGQIDFVLQVSDGRIIVDHKADPRAVGDGDRLANTHGGQLEAYEDAVRAATGDPVLGSWLFLPVAAKAVRIAR